MISNEHCSTDTIRKSSNEVNLLCRDTIPIRFQANHSAADAERSAVNILIRRHRCEILRGPFRHVLIPPQELPRLCIHSDDPFSQQLHILLAATALDHDCGRITCRITVWYRGFPNQRARLFVESYYRCLGATGRNHNHVSIDEWRLCIGPLTRLPAKLGPNILLPANLSGLRFKTRKIAVGAKRIEQVAVNRRRRSCFRIVWLLLWITDVADARGPDNFSILS